MKTPAMSERAARPKRERVDYGALRESLANSRAVYHPPRPASKPRVRYVHAPMGLGLPCTYRHGKTVLTLVSVRDGVATVEKDGRQWTEPLAALIGVRG